MLLRRSVNKKHRPLLPAIVGAVLVLAALAWADPATAAQHPSPGRAVSTAAPTPGTGAGMGIVNDPAAYARAIRSGDWIRTPDGLMYKTCVYHIPSGARINGDTIVYRGGATHRMAPCAHPTLAYPAGSNVIQMRPGTGGASPASASARPPLATGWWSDWWWHAPSFLTYLFERFSVPADPAQSGALIFFFPALESQDPSPNILQPVLTWGANPGVVSNPNIWYITSWYVINGHGAFSDSIHVAPGDTIDGTISAQNCNVHGACAWTVTTGVEGGSSQSIPATVGVPFVTVFGGAMEVPAPGISSCAQLPSEGHEAFRNLSAVDNDGAMPSTAVFTIVNQGSCGATVYRGVATGGDITWTP